MSTDTPLVVDLDGTLTPTDTLLESVLQMAKSHPFKLMLLPFWLLRGKAGFKQALARHSDIAVEHLPYRQALLDYLRTQKEQGRRLILATASPEKTARGVAGHLGLFDDVLASDPEHNLKAEAKLHAIQEKVGMDFVYAGDSRADIPVWRAAKAAILVSARESTARMIRGNVPIECEFPRQHATAGTWLRALRVHQWLKNLLLFVPALTAFSFTESQTLAPLILAFLAFSLAASASYVANDLSDLENDRAHPRKRNRPFASATIPIPQGIAVAGLALVAALLIALAVSPGFLGILIAYLVLTVAYSLRLKEHAVIDVVTLAVLYTLRIIAGSVAAAVVTSTWLLAFSVFIFLSLALVKRCSELVALQEMGIEESLGRGYRASDLVVLWPFGVGAALSAVVVFGLFINSPETQLRYATPQLLWLVALGLIYWLVRMWLKTSRGEMHDDPLIYTISDAGSRTVILAMVAATIAARFLLL